MLMKVDANKGKIKIFILLFNNSIYYLGWA